jgi:hypothetical protein
MVAVAVVVVVVRALFLKGCLTRAQLVISAVVRYTRIRVKGVRPPHLYLPINHSFSILRPLHILLRNLLPVRVKTMILVVVATRINNRIIILLKVVTTAAAM